MTEKNHLNVLSLALALGIACAVYALFIGVVAWLFGWGTSIVEVISSLYIGYKPTPLGSIIGGIWAFIDGFIGGVIIVWLYNRLQQTKQGQ